MYDDSHPRYRPHFDPTTQWCAVHCYYTWTMAVISVTNWSVPQFGSCRQKNITILQYVGRKSTEHFDVVLDLVVVVCTINIYLYILRYMYKLVYLFKFDKSTAIFLIHTVSNIIWTQGNIIVPRIDPWGTPATLVKWNVTYSHVEPMIHQFKTNIIYKNLGACVALALYKRTCLVCIHFNNKN
jgi:hypothetical protein